MNSYSFSSAGWVFSPSLLCGVLFEPELEPEFSLPEEYELQDGKYIRMPYRIVTQENLGEIQMLLMKK